MAKGKHTKKEKFKKKKVDDDQKLKDLASQKEKDEDSGRVNENELELARIQAIQLRVAQKTETDSRISDIKKAVLQLRQNRWDEKMWNRYMCCDGRPALDDIRQLNAFISNWLDEEVTQDPQSILFQCDAATELLREIQQMKFDTDIQQLKDYKYEQIQFDLKMALDMKINMATFNSLLDMSSTIDLDTGNSFCTYRNATAVVAIWANLVCNTRYNGYNVSEIGVTFTIPRDIISNECAIRIMTTNFDHLSPLSKKYSRFEMLTFSYDVKDDEVPILVFEINRKFEVVDDDWDEGSIDLREFFTIGSILHLQLVSVPTQPHKVKNWTMTKIEPEQRLQFVSWNCTYVPPCLPSEKDESKKDDEEEAELEKQRANEMNKLLFVTWQLPADIIYCDVPRLARWDIAKQYWTSSKILDVTYKEENPSISFYTSEFGVFSILLPKFVSFPYQQWDLTSIEDSNIFKALFTITTMTGCVEIMIKGNTCELIQVMSNDRLFLESLYGLPMKPSDLIEKLQSVGLVITSSRDDYVLTNSLKAKNRNLEDTVYKQMALACADFSAGFVFSRWNSVAGADKILVRIQDKTMTNPKMSQTVIMVSEAEAYILAVIESGQSFSEKLMDNQTVNTRHSSYKI